jgi:uncharacterized protein YjbI with pentapeptide repeats
VEAATPRPDGLRPTRAGELVAAYFAEFQFHALRCIRSSPSLFIRDSWLFATLPSTRRWIEEVAGLADARKIKELLRGFFGRRAVRVVGVVALLVVVVAVLFLVLDWYVTPATPGERKDLVLAVAQILGGTALLLGLYFTWRTLQVNREGQITERFTRAIDQLGKIEDGKKLFEIRIGGIYALERIAKESEEDYWPIMEVLTAYVRQNAPRPTEEDKEGTDDATEAQSNMEGSRVKWVKLETIEIPDPDIQAITSVLRRRKHYYLRGEPESLDFRVTNLSGVDLSGADLRDADLRGTSLYGADLTRADLREASLTDADLREASLYGADFSGASLYGADLSGVSLRGAIIVPAGVSSEEVSRELNSGEPVSRELLSAPDLRDADLRDADLRGARLFDGVRLSGANLSGANLSGADLSGAQHLTQEQLEQAEGDENTQLPPPLKLPEHWGVKTDEQPEGG